MIIELYPARTVSRTARKVEDPRWFREEETLPAATYYHIKRELRFPRRCFHENLSDLGVKIFDSHLIVDADGLLGVVICKPKHGIYRVVWIRSIKVNNGVE